MSESYILIHCEVNTQRIVMNRLLKNQVLSDSKMW